MKHSQKKIITVVKMAMLEGVVAAAKSGNVSDATVYDWCKKAGIKPARNPSKIDWEQVAVSVMKGVKN